MHGKDVFPIGLKVQWQPANESNINNNYLHNWLLDTGSLTERIQSLCRSFEVVRIGQGAAPLHDHESALLSGKDADYEVREVLLMADNTPWVFARSVVPVSLTQGEWRHLGNKPLGKLLFNDQRFKRSEFEIATLSSTYFSSLNIASSEHALYGRRSLFTLASLQVLVCEVFLPASPAYSGNFL